MPLGASRHEKGRFLAPSAPLFERVTGTLNTMKVLVLGPGGREHAIIRALLRDPEVTEVHSAPGNAGIAQDVPVHAIDANDPAQAIALARELNAPGCYWPGGAAGRRCF